MTDAAPTEPRPDIGIVTLAGLPLRLDDLVDKLNTAHVRAALRTRTPSPMAGLELYLPSAVILFIASSYFAGAIQKAGEDHYLALKAVGRSLLQRVRGTGASLSTQSDSVSRPTYSLAWSIVGETRKGVRFKLVLTTETGETDAGDAIDAFLDMVRALEEGTLSMADQEALRTYPIIGGHVVVTFDAVTRQIVPVTFTLTGQAEQDSDG